MSLFKRWSPRTRRLALAAAAVVALSGLVYTGAQAQADGQATECKDAAVPVKVGGTSGSIAGTLCTPPNATAVQLLVHGWTYNRQYFDTPYESGTYSYSRAANAAGYATFAIDRLAAGESLHPLSLFDTFDNDVRTVHEVVQALRDGSLGSTFDKVVGVGHSTGSAVVTAEVGKYNDLDAVVTTGYTHMFNSVYTAPTVAGRDYLASGDEQFADRDLDPLYLTSIPGTRYTFYEKDNADPKMIDTDEKVMRDTTSLIKLATMPVPGDLKNQNRHTNLPVLAVNGAHEPLFCGLGTATCTSDDAIAEFERKWYGPKATVEGYSVPGTGHDIMLEKNSPKAAKRILRFVDKYVGHGDGMIGSAPGTRPEIVERSQTRPPLTARLANKALSAAVLPLVDRYADTVDPLPGMDGSNPVPITGDLMVAIAKLVGHAQDGLHL
ncbi:MAG TPA: alpha/beta hydrolase [Stackebrandtia sp.]|uniref:alpha/beta hydrolase n=1 Tax=Stackebrandtia sp. TaxID=2023065 RepID=UPI002D2E1E0D|nr:alpha/beta hydrolase [Stackebrandtia sp.]HZE40099.1 alpha/beta hydrolase [Stackebrandtia sp.]